VKVALLTREYPPEVYGGAGVHVEYLARELAQLEDVTVHAWGGEGAVVHRAWDALSGDAPHMAALRAMSIDLSMTAGVEGTDVVHTHTWYTQLAGHLAKLTYGVPHVATVHSLEPLRPWKAEQLGGGYALSSWCEKVALEGADAVIAVSKGSREDILACYPAIDPARVRVIYNGIDAREYTPDPSTDVLERHGVDPDRPSVVFVGRITRQKGVPYLVEAALEFDEAAQLVLCAGAPDTPEIACPSIYEPLGIVNLEAMACEAAVVATATGGIVEVVVDGVTGLLVPFETADGDITPRDPDAFVAGIAERVNALVRDPARAREMGRAGRERAVGEFDWAAIARQTVEVYRSLA
jgi:starch synthase